MMCAFSMCIYEHDEHTATHCNTLQHTATHCNTGEREHRTLEAQLYIDKHLRVNHVCIYDVHIRT